MAAPRKKAPGRARRATGRITEKKKPVQIVVPLCMEPTAALRLTDLVDRRRFLEAQVKNDPSFQDELDEVVDQIDELRPFVDENTYDFVGISIGRNPWEELKSLHPPSPEQSKKAKKDGFMSLAWNTETFYPDAFKVGLKVAVEWDEDNVPTVLRDLDEEEITEILDGEKYNEGEITQLMRAVVDANSASPRVGDLGNA